MEGINIWPSKNYRKTYSALRFLLGTLNRSLYHSLLLLKTLPTLQKFNSLKISTEAEEAMSDHHHLYVSIILYSSW